MTGQPACASPCRRGSTQPPIPTSGWRFEQVEGSLVLIRRLIEGDWGDSDFLVLQPGQRLAMSYDDSVVRGVPG